MKHIFAVYILACHYDDAHYIQSLALKHYILFRFVLNVELATWTERCAAELEKLCDWKCRENFIN